MKRHTRLKDLWKAYDDLEAIFVGAMAENAWTPATNAKVKAVQVRERIDELEQIAAAKRRRKQMTPELLYAELAAEARALRVGAMASASHVAAVQALKLEADLVAAKAAAGDAASAAALETMSIDELEAEVIELRKARGG